MSFSSSKKPSASKIILIIWLIFSIFYVGYNEYHRLRFVVYNRGVQDTALRLIEQSTQCQPVPVVAGQARVDVISINCLREPEPITTSEE